MKASEAFFLGIPRRVLTRPPKKVFIIGFHKTGTSSMGKAFQILGYRVCGSIKESKNYKKEDIPIRQYILSEAKRLVLRYDCFQDTPWFMLYKEMYEQYPDSSFILTTRPDEDWIKSIVSHFGKRRNSRYHEWIYGYSDPLMNREAYLRTYQEHNQSVREFFRNKSNFLEMNLKEKDKWEKLCDFLGVPVPGLKFPRANTAASRETIYRKIKESVKDLYYK